MRMEVHMVIHMPAMAVEEPLEQPQAEAMDRRIHTAAMQNGQPSSQPSFGKAFVVNSVGKPDYAVGDRVRHIKFGPGTVEALEKGDKDYEVTVNFDRCGVRKMFASFAKLKKCE